MFLHSTCQVNIRMSTLWKRNCQNDYMGMNGNRQNKANMEIWKYGNMEIWKYGNIEIWKYGNMEI